MMLSIVTTLYYSAPYIEEFYQGISTAVQDITEDYEIIFVNDGSPDNSLEIALNIHARNLRVKIVDLSCNFGHHKAMMTGLGHARGEHVFLIDSDLEEDPSLLSRFWQELHSTDDVDVVYGVQTKRKGNFFEKITGQFFYYLYNLLTDVKIPPNIVTCRLMSRRYVQALLEFREQEIFMAGIWYAVGFKQKALSITKLDHSTTTYTFRKKMRILINSITSFSKKPLVYIFYLGSFITGVSLLFAIYFIVRRLTHNIGVEGWTSLIVSLWLLGGIILFCIGILGIYLSKIFTETKNRPYTIIKNYYEH